jgi:Zinc carboxypeptidase
MFISYFFDNGSPCNWDFCDGELVVDLLYDHEAGATNKAAGHFHFSVDNPERQPVRIRIKLATNIWNGQLGSPFKADLPSYYSEDGKIWQVFVWTHQENGDLVAEFGDLPFFYLVRLEPYTETDLKQLCNEIKDHPAVSMSNIGTTLEQRSLDIIHIGTGEQRVLLRARAHPWEPGGNWVIDGLISEFLAQYETNPEKVKNIAFDILPIANKDGVARGMTRFNLKGADLNRGFSRPRAELAVVAPENIALLEWLDRQQTAGTLPVLALDFHNDCNGGLLIPAGDEVRLGILADSLRRHTFAPETVISSPNKDGFAAGVHAQYGIAAATLEFNAKYIKNIEQLPTAAHWQQFGRDFLEVALEFISENS